MNHPFAPIANELKAKRFRLNRLTYVALFGRDLEDRQKASAEATVLRNQIDAQLRQAGEWAAQVSDFVRSPGQDSLVYTLDRFIEVIEGIKADQDMAAQPSGRMATPGCMAGVPHL